MRCAMRSRGVVRCPDESSCSAGGSFLGRIVSLSGCMRCPGRAEIPRPGLLPGTGVLSVLPERPPGGCTLPWCKPVRTAVTGADGPRSDVGPGAVYGRGGACGTHLPPLPRAGAPRRSTAPNSPVGCGPDAPPSTGASPRTATPPARTERQERSAPCPRNVRGSRRRTRMTLPQEPGNDRRPFSSARPHRVLRTLTSSSGRRSGPGHGLPRRLTPP